MVEQRSDGGKNELCQIDLSSLVMCGGYSSATPERYVLVCVCARPTVTRKVRRKQPTRRIKEEALPLVVGRSFSTVVLEPSAELNSLELPRVEILR